MRSKSRSSKESNGFGPSFAGQQTAPSGVQRSRASSITFGHSEGRRSFPRDLRGFQPSQNGGAGFAFVIYSFLAALVTILIFTIGRGIPSTKNPHSEWLAPYGRLIGNAVSLSLYLVILAEGFLIVGSFSYLGSFIEKVYHFNNLYIGLIMTAFGAASVIAGRVSGGLAGRIGKKMVLVLGLLSATVADTLLFFRGDLLSALIIAVFLLGLGFMLAHSTLTTIATRFAARAQGAAMSLVAFCFMGGGGVGTAVGGNLLRAHGFQALYSYYGLALLVLMVLAGYLVKTETDGAMSAQGSGGQSR